MKKTKSIALMAMFTALAMVFAYIEVLIPPILPAIPGIKMGLPNIIIIFLLYRRGPLWAGLVSLLRIIMISLLFGNIVSFLYSLAGGILSLLVMMLFKNLKIISQIGVSVCGGVFHNVGQILMAMLLLETTQLAYYLVVLTVTGTFTGILIGLCGNLLIKKIPKKLL